MCRSIISMVFSHVLLIENVNGILKILMFFTQEINIAMSESSFMAIVCWCLISSRSIRMGWFTKYGNNIMKCAVLYVHYTATFAAIWCGSYGI